MPKMNFKIFLMSLFVFECLLVCDQLPKRKFFFVLVFFVWCLLVCLVFFVQIVVKLYCWNVVKNFCFCLPKKTACSLVQTVQVILSKPQKLLSDKLLYLKFYLKPSQYKPSFVSMTQTFIIFFTCIHG